MLTTFDIDEKLLEEALSLSNNLSKNLTISALIEISLQEYIQNHQNTSKQMKILDLFGTIEYEDNYDYKEQRQRV